MTDSISMKLVIIDEPDKIKQIKRELFNGENRRLSFPHTFEMPCPEKSILITYINSNEGRRVEIEQLLKNSHIFSELCIQKITEHPILKKEISEVNVWVERSEKRWLENRQGKNFPKLISPKHYSAYQSIWNLSMESLNVSSHNDLGNHYLQILEDTGHGPIIELANSYEEAVSDVSFVKEPIEIDDLSGLKRLEFCLQAPREVHLELSGYLKGIYGFHYAHITCINAKCESDDWNDFYIFGKRRKPANTLKKIFEQSSGQFVRLGPYRINSDLSKFKNERRLNGMYRKYGAIMLLLNDLAKRESDSLLDSNTSSST